jgi:NADH:ubiquinone oxidoreductase subunit F (NADH-binding)
VPDTPRQPGQPAGNRPSAQYSLLGAPNQPALSTLDAYRRAGGYAAQRRALTGMTPEQVIDEIRAAQLRGRGGAGILAAEKLALVAGAEDDTKYLLCNAYDADPRSQIASALLERNPHLVLEGMALAAYACGATEGFLYMRGNRTAAAAAAQKALGEALEQGWLGRGIQGAPFDFAVTVVGVERGFMGGEESTAIEIIKGRPMKASQRPPYPTTYGLFDKPTAVLNIETLANLPVIVARGGDAYRAVGSKESPGTKLLTVFRAGASEAQGQVIEAPFGVTLQQALRAAGAEANESVARGVVVGGMEGGVLPLALLNTPLDYEPLETVGAIIGSSIVEVLPADTCMVRFAMERMRYLSEETCGKCVPCRVGVKRVAGTLEAIVSGLGTKDDLALLEEFSHYIPDGSLCGFGVNAVHPLVTAMKYFADDFTAHLEGRCPTGTCVPVRAHRYVTKHVL